MSSSTHQASRSENAAARLTDQLLGKLAEVAGILLLVTAIWLGIALLSYHPSDPGWSFAAAGADMVHNAGGRLGAWLANLILYFLGYPGYALPCVLLLAAGRAFHTRRRSGFDPLQLAVHIIGCLLLLIGAVALSWMHFGIVWPLPHEAHGAGGVLGSLVASPLQAGLGETGATLFSLALFFIGVGLYTGLSWLRLTDAAGRFTLKFFAWCWHRPRTLRSEWEDDAQGCLAKQARGEVLRAQQQEQWQREPPRIEPLPAAPPPSKRLEEEKQQVLFEPPPRSKLPALHLLDEPESGERCYTEEALDALSRLLELKLKDFGVSVQVMEVHPGPVITRFELSPAAGVKVSQISNLSKDLARALSVVSVRIVEIIPGKSVIGLEIPNERREMVGLREILGSDEYARTKSPLALGLGKDIGGSTVVVDLAKMPHLLVAGTTGSGKSVALNAMILSLLYKSSAESIRLIMIDPKMLELSVYEGIPHLLAPVVTDMKEAANALRWSVAEMERRYRLLAAVGVRSIASYNRKVEEAKARGEHLPDPLFQPAASEDPEAPEQEPPALECLPRIVVIVDELADMMMTVGKKVEELIARLAQKARAAGIHLVLATQRPSVDVITGLIKANIPSRIAFQVSSKVDSRTILDQMGAESLLGHGDMLYLPPGTSIPERVHGAFVSDDEVHNVVRNIREGAEPDYLDEILKGPGEGGAAPVPGFDAKADDAADPLYDEAARIVAQTRKSSISYLQRRLKVGYNRAARLVEAMEEHGLLGPLDENGGREVRVAPPPAAD